jgi:hypothetical protein
MEHEHHAVNHHSINESFYSEHAKIHGPVKVFNLLHYLMAQHCIETGITSWQRVVPVAQRERVEKWLGAHYPVPALA